MSNKPTEGTWDQALQHAGLVGACLAEIRIQQPWIDRFEADELFQVGMIGLERAVRNFDPDRGAKFTTYAATAIKRCIWDCINRDQQAADPTDLSLSALMETIEADDDAGSNAMAARNAVSVPSAEETYISENVLDPRVELVLETLHLLEQNAEGSRYSGAMFRRFRQHFIDGRSLRDIAGDEKTSVQAISASVNRAVAMIRFALSVEPSEQAA